MGLPTAIETNTAGDSSATSNNILEQEEVSQFKFLLCFTFHQNYRFLNVDVKDLRIGDVAALLEEYKRLAYENEHFKKLLENSREPQPPSTPHFAPIGSQPSPKTSDSAASESMPTSLKTMPDDSKVNEEASTANLDPSVSTCGEENLKCSCDDVNSSSQSVDETASTEDKLLSPQNDVGPSLVAPAKTLSGTPIEDTDLHAPPES